MQVETVSPVNQQKQCAVHLKEHITETSPTALLEADD